MLEHNPCSFLTGDSPFVNLTPSECSVGRYEAQLVFELHHEGVIGMPHGGVSMGLCLDAWRRSGRFDYPIDVRFRFGGSGMGIGENALLSVESGLDSFGQSMTARISREGQQNPYLRAEISPSHGGADLPEWIPTPSQATPRKLPYYRNCFVCGHHRTVVGLQRRFRLHLDDGAPTITTPWGPDGDDFDRAKSFLIGKTELHPAVLVSIFDENTGWAGFMTTRTAGLTVRMEFTVLRPVLDTEQLLFVSRPAGVKGNSRAPRFFKAEGAVLAMTDSGNPDVVAYGRGEWLILDHITEQVKKNLLPSDDWEWIFDDRLTSR